MVTVAIDERYADLFTMLGGIQESANLAMQRYVVEQITTKISELKGRDATYAQKYGMSYTQFLNNLETVEFVEKVEAEISNIWEIDLADWEFCHEGVKDWTRKLQSVLLG